MALFHVSHPPWLRPVGVRTSYTHFSNISWTPRVLDPITNPFLGPSSWLHPASKGLNAACNAPLGRKSFKAANLNHTLWCFLECLHLTCVRALPSEIAIISLRQAKKIMTQEKNTLNGEQSNPNWLNESSTLSHLSGPQFSCGLAHSKCSM